MSDQEHILADQSLSDQIATLESELASVRQELEHTSRLASLGLVAAGIAHEINNILTPVLAYAQLASAKNSDPEMVRKSVEKSLHGVQLATQIAQAMLGFASTAHQEPQCNVLQTVDAALTTIGRDPAKDGIRVDINVNPTVEVAMRPLALQQVLMNLILNACTAMRGKGGRLQITATPIPHESRTEIRVSDTGPGIPKEIAGRLFEPFVSAPRSVGMRGGRPSQTSGSGLGLSICRRLVEEAQGSISASSPPGHGTTFTIVLPSAFAAQRARAV